PEDRMMRELADVHAFHALDLEARAELGRELAQKLGPAWRGEQPVAEEDALPVVHVASGVSCVVVPGGEFQMGLTERDLEEAAEHVDWTSEVADLAKQVAERARPVHTVRVRPFVCARRRLDVPQAVALSGGKLEIDSGTRAEAKELASALGL